MYFKIYELEFKLFVNSSRTAGESFSSYFSLESLVVEEINLELSVVVASFYYTFFYSAISFIETPSAGLV